MQRRGDRPDRGGRPRRRACAATTPDGPLEIRADLRRRRRRPPLDGARRRRARGRGRRRADGRALVPPRRASPTTRPSRSAASTPASILVMIDRGDYWQCALRHPQGRRSTQLRAAGPRRPSARDVAALVAVRSPTASASSRDWDDVKLLTVARRPADARGTGRACSASATRRTRCRRSAASASTSRSRTRSPPPTSWPGRCARAGSPRPTSRRVQRRRELPTRRHPAAAGAGPEPGHQPRARSREELVSRRSPLRLLARFPRLRRLPARLIGIGVRPEHIGPAILGRRAPILSGNRPLAEEHAMATAHDQQTRTELEAAAFRAWSSTCASGPTSRTST